MVPVRWVKLTAWLNLLGNLLIIATGGAVRLTASGLGCDNWPLCNSTSLTPGIDEGIHGLIEFGNRMMSPLLGILAVAALVAVWRFRPVWRTARSAPVRTDLWVHAWIILGGVVAQGIIGGIVVLSHLSVSTVGVHYFVSAAIVGVAASFVLRAYRTPGPRVRAIPLWLAILTHVGSLLLVLVVIGGILTTQAGPHSGDDDIIRDSSAWATFVHVHAWLGYALAAVVVVLLVGALLLRVRRYAIAVGSLALVIAVQIAVGIAQANLGIPALLVGIHMVLAALTVAVGVVVVDAVKRPAPPVLAEPVAPAEPATVAG
jgi:cytochrome c oxidase assembly protein subunit 15